ncbi:MAG: hypothetical protein LBD18_05165 [Treponema sp.]|nr:hypothetical protein [Treponema sp.]
MKKRCFLGISAVLLVFGLVFTGCEQPVAETLSSEAKVSSVTIAGVEARLKAPSDQWNQAEAGIIFIPDNKMQAAPVSAKASSGATVYFASSPSELLVPNFVEEAVFDFEDNDICYVEVFSANHDAFNIYKIQVRIYSSLAALSSLTINGLDAPYGNPGTAWNSERGGSIFAGYKPDNWTISATATPNSNAVIKYAKASGGAQPASFTATPPDSFDWGDYLYVQVTSEQGDLTYYYKTKILYHQERTIQWGQPDVTTARTIDPVWENVAVFDVSNVYPVDSTAEFIANPDTSAWAKVLWDYDGIYVLVEVTDPDPCTLDNVTGNQHLYDSVEVFLDEDRPATGATGGYGSDGGQYRIGSQGTKSGTASNFPGTAWVTETGYIIQMRAPFRWAQRNPDNGTRIGFDITVNVAHGNEPSRYGVLAWNNVVDANYNNVTNFGVINFAGRPQETDASLASLTIGGKTAALGTPNANYSNATAGSVTLGASQANSSLTVTPVTTGRKTSLKYAKVTGSGAPNFDTGASLSLNAGDVVYIQATAENGSVLVYKIEVGLLSDDTSLGSVSIADQTATIGNSAASFTAAEVKVVTVDNENALANVTVTANPTDTLAGVRYGTSTANTNPVNWSTTGTFTSLTNGAYIGVEVTAQDGTVNYFKFRIAYGNSDATPTAITVGGVSVTLGTPGTYSGNGPFAGGTAGSVTLTAEQAGNGSNVTVAATLPSGATVRYNWGADFFGSQYTAGTWNTTGAGLFAGGSAFGGFVTVDPGVNNALIFIEVTSENGIVVNVYAVSCRVSG